VGTGDEDGRGTVVEELGAGVFEPRTTTSQEPELYPNLMKVSELQTIAVNVTPSIATTKFPSPSTEKTFVKPSGGTLDGETK